MCIATKWLVADLTTCCLVLQLDPDEESKKRLKLIRGEAVDKPLKAPPPFKTAQDELREAELREAAEAEAAAAVAEAEAALDQTAEGPAASEDEDDEAAEGQSFAMSLHAVCFTGGLFEQAPSTSCIWI